ncbi:MAG: hypothetical protein Q9181_005535 [Wetmoreana brouardii]
MAPGDINLPAYQGHCVKVSAINGARSHMLARMLVHPPPPDNKYLDLAGYSFLIESSHRDQKVLFDLAFMKDLSARMPPTLKAMLRAGDDEVMRIDELHDIPTTVQQHGLDLAAINAVIWSHAHIDHVGDPAVFPPSTELVVGPGLKARCMPGYPTDPDGFVLDSAFQGRCVREVDFSTSSSATIGGFAAVDFFADGSFWLLHAPGHTEDHIGALCRTTVDSWILCAGDACHSVAQLRPNHWRPLPDSVLPANMLGGRISTSPPPPPPPPPPPERRGCAHVSSLVPHTDGSAFYGLAPGMAEDLQKAEETVEKLKALDGRDDVMIIAAHDASLLDVLEFFPQDINDWKARGWADQGRWLFLKTLAPAPL